MHLTKLSVRDCGLADADLAHVASLQQLTSLDLSNNDRVTDEGVAHLQGLALLADLKLFGCDRVTKRGLARVAHVARVSGVY